MSHDDQPAPVSMPAEFPLDAHADAPDSLAAFPTEAQVAATAARRAERRRLAWLGPIALAVVAVVAVLAVWLAVPAASAYVRSRLGMSGPDARATLIVETTPPGCEVTEGDRRLGTTPLTVPLAKGRHTLLLQKGSSTRPLKVTLPVGAQVVHHLNLAAEPTTGVLHVATFPPGAAVEVDGVRSGTSPVDVAGLAPGNHSVGLRSGNRVVNQRVTISPGATATLPSSAKRRSPTSRCRSVPTNWCSGIARQAGVRSQELRRGGRRLHACALAARRSRSVAGVRWAC